MDKFTAVYAKMIDEISKRLLIVEQSEDAGSGKLIIVELDGFPGDTKQLAAMKDEAKRAGVEVEQGEEGSAVERGKVRYTLKGYDVKALYRFIKDRWPSEDLESLIAETEMVATFDDKTLIDPRALFEQME